MVPVFDEEQSLSELVRRVDEASASWDIDHEILFVDDGSRDRSFEIVEQLATERPNCRGIALSRNFGHQAAVSAGLAHAEGDAVVVLDADLQDPPEVIGALLDRWREGYQVVYAERTRRKEGLFKRAAYRVFYRLLASISQVEIPLDAGDFCLLDRQVVTALAMDFPETDRFVRGLRAYAGFRQVGVPYERAARERGRSKYSLFALFRLAISGLVGFSFVPLRLASLLGFLVALPSFLLVAFFLSQRLIGFSAFGRNATETPGIATLAIGLFFLSGVILMMLGILGEYIARIFIEVKRRPPFLVARKVGWSLPSGDEEHR